MISIQFFSWKKAQSEFIFRNDSLNFIIIKLLVDSSAIFLFFIFSRYWVAVSRKILSFPLLKWFLWQLVQGFLKIFECDVIWWVPEGKFLNFNRLMEMISLKWEDKDRFLTLIWFTEPTCWFLKILTANFYLCELNNPKIPKKSSSTSKKIKIRISTKLI